MEIEPSEKQSLKVLLKNNADMNISDKSSWTPLHTAASKTSEEVLKMLINFNAKVDLKDDEGRTALDVAKENGNLKCVEILEKCGIKKSPMDLK
jgi:uncharacterized protein